MRAMETRRLVLIHAFDAYAGSQKVAGQLARGLRARGWDVKLVTGFGRTGFLTDAGVSRRFLGTENIGLRKLLYPLWLIVCNMQALAWLADGRKIWANSIHALPGVLAIILFAPHRLVVHLHEVTFEGPFRWLVRFAAGRGATLVAVSKSHALALELPATILPNAVGDTPPASPASRRRLLFVGSTRALKGFPLFLKVAQLVADTGLQPVAYVSAGILGPSADDIAAARASGVQLVIGETDPARIFTDAFLTLQLTDPALWVETFSLVAAESVWNLVPIGAAGADVVNEVAAGAVAFNEVSRNPQKIAADIRRLRNDGQRYEELVQGCAVRREDYAMARFLDRAERIALGRARDSDADGPVVLPQA